MHGDGKPNFLKLYITIIKLGWAESLSKLKGSKSGGREEEEEMCP